MEDVYLLYKGKDLLSISIGENNFKIVELDDDIMMYNRSLLEISELYSIRLSIVKDIDGKIEQVKKEFPDLDFDDVLSNVVKDNPKEVARFFSLYISEKHDEKIDLSGECLEDILYIELSDRLAKETEKYLSERNLSFKEHTGYRVEHKKVIICNYQNGK